MRVLIVEDDVFLAEALQTGLRLEAIAADIASDGQEALDVVELVEYDVVVLDRDLPRVHGDIVCEQLAKRTNPPRILMLTASAALGDKVGGLALGADDYLTKPFEFDELTARVRALYRRATPALPPILEVDDLRLDSFRREAYRAGRYVPLTRKEFAVLEVLMRADGGVISAEKLLEKAWDENADPFTNAIRVTVSTLRKKLGSPALVHTVAGVGYRITSKETSP